MTPKLTGEGDVEEEVPKNHCNFEFKFKFLNFHHFSDSQLLSDFQTFFYLIFMRQIETHFLDLQIAPEKLLFYPVVNGEGLGSRQNDTFLKYPIRFSWRIFVVKNNLTEFCPSA